MKTLEYGILSIHPVDALRKACAVLMAIMVIAVVPIAAMGASGKCTVTKSQGTTLELECTRETTEFQPGTKIKIKTDRKAAVEGC